MSHESAERAPHLSLRERAGRAVRTVRWWGVVVVPVIVIVANSFGPDGWREPLNYMLLLSWAAIFAAMAHAARRILFPRSDFSALYLKATEDPIGAAIVAAGILIFTAMMFLGIVSTAHAQDVRTYIPQNARALLPLLRQQQEEALPGYPFPSYFGALIEQESCISLTHSRCWNSRAQLKTAREEGAGLGQFTRAWAADGSQRFDALAEVRALDPVALRDFTWSTVYARADLGMRAILVKSRDCLNRMERQSLASPFDRMAFCDAAYNGGLAGMLADRRICEQTAGCDAQRWFGQVERTSTKSRQRWQGYGKSAFEINREHVQNALVLRRPKYRAALGADLL